ncbi:MAG: oxaloacetate decarboxylase [Dehalococcoidia bacterium]|nr:MAG: oxaloacetate decarboxylase [Dehalococcoidia bacterium]
MEQSSLNDAFWILIVGMITVFIILWLVVLTGNLIIKFVNRFVPETEGSKRVTKASALSNGTSAAISAAVSIITNGKGKVTKITKV